MAHFLRSRVCDQDDDATVTGALATDVHGCTSTVRSVSDLSHQSRPVRDSYAPSGNPDLSKSRDGPCTTSASGDGPPARLSWEKQLEGSPTASHPIFTMPDMSLSLFAFGIMWFIRAQYLTSFEAGLGKGGNKQVDK